MKIVINQPLTTLIELAIIAITITVVYAIICIKAIIQIDKIRRKLK
jgi:hypothetical protein